MKTGEGGREGAQMPWTPASCCFIGSTKPKSPKLVRPYYYIIILFFYLTSYFPNNKYPNENCLEGMCRPGGNRFFFRFRRLLGDISRAAAFYGDIRFRHVPTWPDKSDDPMGETSSCRLSQRFILGIRDSGHVRPVLLFRKTNNSKNEN